MFNHTHKSVQISVNESNIEKSDIDVQHEMELQLHEQYAVNNNAYVSSTVAFICGVMAVLGAFGYVYLFSSQETATNFGDLAKHDNVFTVDALMLTADAAIMVLAILFLFCLDRGAYQRKEQFITYAIRCKYFSELNGGVGEEEIKIFPDNYTPFGKSWIGFVQGVFGFMLKAIAFVACVIVVLTAIKIPNLISPNMFGLILLTACVTLLIACPVYLPHKEQRNFLQAVIKFILVAIVIVVLIAKVVYNNVSAPYPIAFNRNVMVWSVICVTAVVTWCGCKQHKAYLNYRKLEKEFIKCKSIII